MRSWHPSSTTGMLNDRGRTPWAGLIALVLPLLATACAVPTTTEVEVVAETLHVTDEAIVLFPTLRAAGLPTNAGFVRCLRTGLEKRVTPKPKFVEPAAFQDAMFPWFEFEHAPQTVRELNALLLRPLVRERIASLGVRYLISIAGSSDLDCVPGLLCPARYPSGASAVDLRWKNTTSRLNAVVWDMVSGDQAGELSVTSSGTSVTGAFIIPFYFIAYTERDACEALAAELGQRLYDPTNPKTSDP